MGFMSTILENTAQGLAYYSQVASMPWALVLIVKEGWAAVVHPLRQGRGWSAEAGGSRPEA